MTEIVNPAESILPMPLQMKNMALENRDENTQSIPMQVDQVF